MIPRFPAQICHQESFCAKKNIFLSHLLSILFTSFRSNSSAYITFLQLPPSLVMQKKKLFQDSSAELQFLLQQTLPQSAISWLNIYQSLPTDTSQVLKLGILYLKEHNKSDFFLKLGNNIWETFSFLRSIHFFLWWPTCSKIWGQTRSNIIQRYQFPPRNSDDTM